MNYKNNYKEFNKMKKQKNNMMNFYNNKIVKKYKFQINKKR